jgi:hypothetical protein
MKLTQDSTVVSGAYVLNGKSCSVQGTVARGRLTFTYREPNATGEGWFELAPDGQSFRGKWRPRGQTAWDDWTARRIVLGLAGLWRTSYGEMRLVQEGDRIHGTYSGAGTLTGKLEKGRLVFRYQETTVKGEGWFALAADSDSFRGKWRPDGQTEWQDWVGTRIEPAPGVVWLVVLEVPWEGGLAEEEYSFGQMLRAFFARAPQVKVRHKFVSSEADLRRWCGELAFLAEPVIVVIASHGSPQGIGVDGKSIGARPLVESLRYAVNVRLLHFSACETMKGKLAQDIRAGLGKSRPLPISGYTTCVDWGASAVIEFLYLDLILARGLTPADAAARLDKLLPFAGDKKVAQAPFASAGFRLLAPEVTVAEKEEKVENKAGSRP